MAVDTLGSPGEPLPSPWEQPWDQQEAGTASPTVSTSYTKCRTTEADCKT